VVCRFDNNNYLPFPSNNKPQTTGARNGFAAQGASVGQFTDVVSPGKKYPVLFEQSALVISAMFGPQQ
jgi:hypothetical protein